jgi:hypothetical protein
LDSTGTLIVIWMTTGAIQQLLFLNCEARNWYC